MIFACNCLNIIIEAEGGEEEVDDSIKKIFCEKSNVQDVMLVKSTKIKKRMNSLISTRDLNEWTGSECINCEIWVYAYLTSVPYKSNQSLIVNLTTKVEPSELENRREDPKFSEIFKILIFDLDSADESDWRRSLDPAAVKWLTHQSIQVDTRIREFTEEQFEMLDAMKKRAYVEQSAIDRAIQRSQPVKTSRLPGSLRSSLEAVSFDTDGTPNKDAVNPFGDPDDTTFEFDESIIFGSKLSENGSQESEESDDGYVDTRTPRSYAQPMLARSMPITMSGSSRGRDRDGDRDESPRTPTDIAASIRALAQSVRGSSIFGDLPPPRFPSKE